MIAGVTSPRVPAAPAELAARIGRVLRERGYREAPLAAMAGLAGPLLDAGLVQARAGLEATTRGDGGALATLVRLFLLQAPAPVDAVARAVAPTPLDDWERCGLLHVDGVEVTAAVLLRPFRQVVIAHDPMRQPGDIPADIVMGVSRSAMSLAMLTVRCSVATALDVGCGTGTQALLAAHHAESVVAVDVNPRAIAYTRFNAALNGITNVDAREGDLYAPVAGERFDLVVSNPPLAISPRSDYVFRDAGMHGDEISATVLRGAAHHLSDGGVAQVMCHWISEGGEDPDTHVRAWARDAGCDVHCIGMTRQTPEEYAREWVEPTVAAADRAAVAAAWAAHLHDLGAASIHGGLVSLRRSSVPPPQCLVDWSVVRAHDGAGDEVLRGFILRDHLRRVAGDDAAFLALRLRTAPGVVLESGQNSGEASLLATQGLGRSIRLDAATAAVVMRCDGTLPLGALLGPAGAGHRVATLRRLAELGLLLPHQAL
jgi:methylase of polypeptide subunit release factors